MSRQGFGNEIPIPPDRVGDFATVRLLEAIKDVEWMMKELARLRAEVKKLKEKSHGTIQGNDKGK